MTRALLEVATPVQKAITRPVHVVRGTWRRYVALVDLQAENEALRAELARVEEENLQYREALVASGQLRRIAESRRSGPHAENILRDVGVVAAGSH